MSLHAIAALFSTPHEATQVFDELKAAGFSRVEISAVDENLPAVDAAPGIYDVAREAAQPSDGAAAPFFRKHDSPASSFADELAQLGFTPDDARAFVAGLTAGGSLVTVDAALDVARAREILGRFDARVTEAAVRDQVASGGERSLQLRAEQLEINKRLVRHGQATVRKEVITEMRSIDVPVTREELVIERHAAGLNAGESATGEPLGAAAEIRIPLSEERVDVHKHAVVLEEVEIGKRRVVETQLVSESLSHEELRVERADESA